MSETTYSIEFAKSGRSACKKCKEKIGTGDIRIQSFATGGKMNITQSFHPSCFTLPRKYAAMSAEQFVEDILEDKSEGDIFPAKKEEIVAAMESAKTTVKKKVSEAAASGEKSGVDANLVKLKALYEEQNPAAINSKENKGKRKKKYDEEDEEEKPVAKKPKTKLDADTQALVDIYGKHCGTSGDQLKDMLRWNRQVMVGTKNQLLWKVVDGEHRGRLARCTVDGGKLKIAVDHPNKVVCNGKFDEDMQTRVPCSVTHTLENAPRWVWYSEEPTGEENEEMELQEKQAAGEEDESAEVGDGSDLGKLMEKAKSLDWDLSSGHKKKKAAQDLMELISGEGVDLPADDKKCFREIGTLISTDASMSAADAVKLVVGKYGFTDKKEEKAAKKEAAISSACANPKNAPLLLIFEELANAYAAEGNKFAVSSTKKVVGIIKNLDFEVTVENALGLGKGKTKVDGIGKGSAEKMKEFLETGKIQKLEDKKAAAA